MPLIPWGEFRPDVADYQAQHSKTVNNVLPRADGYGPFPSLEAFSAALSAACRGFFYARKTDGSVAVFAATSTKIYLMDNTDYTWDDVSKALGTYTAVPSTAQWQFEQFGSVVLAVQANTVPQAFTLGSSTEFADLGGSPPQAAYIAIIGRFVVLSGLTSSPLEIEWSGLNAITTWDGTNFSGSQTFPDGGPVRKIAGVGETGIICQDSTLRRMNYVEGATYTFNIERIAKDKGIFAAYSLVTAGERVFFILNDGFHTMVPGGYPEPIGREKVDRTFLAEVDDANLQLCIGAYDPRISRIYWAYKTLSASGSTFNKVLVYDYVLNRFTPADVTGEYIATLARPGVTLENLDSISGSIDALSFSLDSISVGSVSQLSAFNSDHKLGFFTGANLEATLESSEQGTSEGRRIFVRGFRPITDAATVYGSLKTRESVQASTTASSETLVNTQGLCPQRADTRYARGKVRIPASTSWTFSTGVEPDFVITGQR